MRKVMLLAAMLAMVLAAAAPALAQAVSVGEGDDVQYNAVCQNILGSVGNITNTQGGAAIANANDDSAAAAEVAQKQGVSIEQVNQCLNEGQGAAPVQPPAAPVQQYAGAAQQDVVASPTASASATATASATAAAGGELPETGGTSLLALGAGALLVAGGLLARRIVR